MSDQDQSHSVADSAFSLNRQQPRHGVVGNIFRFPGVVLNALLRRPQTPPAAQGLQQQQLPTPNAGRSASGQLQQRVPAGVAAGATWARQIQVAMPPSQAPGTQLMRHEVAGALSSLKPEQRHLLLDLLRPEPAFACLFAYLPGAGAEASALPAQRTAATEGQLALLKQLTERVRGPDNGPEREPEGPTPAEPVVEALPAAPDTAASAAALTVACVPEFEGYGPAEADKVVRVVVSLTATSEVRKQGNVALSSVLDVSGSMSGRRLELLKETSHFLVQQVTKDDLLGFVTYSDTARVDVPLLRMTPNAKLFAHTIIESLVANGSTALFDGTIAGMRQQLQDLAGDSRLAQALFLCTDGEANVGPQTSDDILPGLHQEQQRHGGKRCTVHAFGIGDGHSAALLQSISEAMSGTYYYIKAHDDVAAAYGDALGGLLSVVAKNVRVTVRAPSRSESSPAGVSTATLLGISAGGTVQGGTVVYNDIYSEESRELLLSFSLAPAAFAPAGAGPSSRPDSSTKHLAEVVVEYVDPASGASTSVVVPIAINLAAEPAGSPHPLVLTTAARYETADVIDQAQKLNMAGKTADAAKMLEAHATQLSSRSGQAPAAAAKQLDLFSQQARAVGEAMQLAERNRHDHAAGQMSYAVTQTASYGLKAQRATNVGVTSSLPMARMYDNQSKQKQRSSAKASVDAALASKSQH